MSEACRFCGPVGTTKRRQEFKDGNVHLREECEKCGSFIKWHKQRKTSFREEIYSIVRALAAATNNEQVALLKAQSEQLMARIKREGTKGLDFDLAGDPQLPFGGGEDAGESGAMRSVRG